MFADVELSSVLHETEKYFTLPRSAEVTAAARAAVFAKRPVSAAGVL